MNDLLKKRAKLIKTQGLCERCKKAPIMFLLIEVMHRSEDHFRMRKLCANCVCETEAEELREMFPFDDD